MTSIIAQPAPDYNQYRAKAQATRAHRQAAGLYKRPTKAQRAAFATLMQRDGRQRLSAEECDLLATHPHLTMSQRAEFAALAAQRRRPTTPLLDDSWIVAVVAKIEALPETLADMTDPYTVGIADAEQGKPCEPTVHYARLGDIEQYICGWKDATEAINAALDLREDALDREYWMRGSW